MSAKGIREQHGKMLLAYHLPRIRVPDNLYGAQAEAKPSTKNAGDNTCNRELPACPALVLPQVAGVRVSSNEDVVPAVEWVAAKTPWMRKTQLALKPDVLLKRRGKSKLLALYIQSCEDVAHHMNLFVSTILPKGLDNFLIEPFVPHEPHHEHYVCIRSRSDGDIIYYSQSGGVNIGDVEEEADNTTESNLNSRTQTVLISPLDPFPTSFKDSLLLHIKDKFVRRDLNSFLLRLYAVYVSLHFTYLEINPLTVIPRDDKEYYRKPNLSSSFATSTDYETIASMSATLKASMDGAPACAIYILDLAAKLDQTAEYICGNKWRVCETNCDGDPEFSRFGVPFSFPAPYGRKQTDAERYVAALDSKTGASLKLTVLNPEGHVWMLVAGGGASVVYADAIVAHGGASKLANYGEYSGAPTESQTYEYARTVLDLMTAGEPALEPCSGCGITGKRLIIGGGIANFTNVAETFKGIVRALRDFAENLRRHKVTIFVRRGGPNWQEGLQLMRGIGPELGIPIHVYGPNVHLTSIVPLALSADCEAAVAAAKDASGGMLSEFGVGKTETNQVESLANAVGASLVFRGPGDNLETNQNNHQISVEESPMPSPGQVLHGDTRGDVFMFTKTTRAIVLGMQTRAVQGMLDFDYVCGRSKPSVAAIVYPFAGGNQHQRVYWGTKELMLPVYNNMKDALATHADVTLVVSFASCRSVFESTTEILQYPTSSPRCIAIIAEGVPERQSRALAALAKRQKNVLIIGPATVGGVRPGCVKIGNTGGMMDNILASKLHRPGSVAYVSKSGGLSNELNNIIAHTTDGVCEGIAIGGDAYPCTTFIDHFLRFEQDENVKIMVLLGEVGGVEEYRVSRAIRDGRISKPVVAWCIGTCAAALGHEFQFGHAGAHAAATLERAANKNRALRDAGAHVPDTFEELPGLLRSVFASLVSAGVVTVRPEPPVPRVPMDYNWAVELGIVRRPAAFVSTICDDRGQELTYSGVPISEVFARDLGIGGVLSLLWFQREMPKYACKFIEMVIMVTADHGPAVSGAHNTIVTARAGKDLVSALCSGLLTIGERFGGALDAAARDFASAYDRNVSPRDFVAEMRSQQRLIMGIGHRVKSVTNPDYRVTVLREYAERHFPACHVLRYALEVEKITTQKKDTLILNVDGAVAAMFVDLLRHSGCFTREEADEILQVGALNGLFVLGRTIGFVGHYLDQRRLRQGLYRHPWDDILYQSVHRSSSDGSQ